MRSGALLITSNRSESVRKMKSSIFYIASLALLFVAQSELNAGLVITSVASVNDGAPGSLTSTVNVRVYGANSGSPLATELVSTFGLKLTISGVAPTISGATFAPNTSTWFAFDSKPSPTTTSNTVTFQGTQTSTTPPNILVTGFGQAPLTLIGTFTFDVAKTASAQSFAITPSPDTAPGSGALIPGGSGFVFYDASFASPIETLFTPPTTIFNGNGTIAAITAVPEPSSFALLGLVTCGYILRRRRAVSVA